MYYYMRDNHTFRQLGDEVEEACRRVEEEYSKGYTCGSVFYRDDVIKVKDVYTSGRHLKPILQDVRRLYSDVAKATIGMGL
jgi:hypothetical protein